METSQFHGNKETVQLHNVVGLWWHMLRTMPSLFTGVSKWRHFCACTLVPSAKEEQPSNIQKLWSKRRTALSQSLLMALEGLFLSVKFGLKIFVYHWIWYLMQGCSSFCPSAMNRDWDFTTSDHDLRAVLLFEMGPKYKRKNDATCSSWWLFFYIPWSLHMFQWQ